MPAPAAGGQALTRDPLPPRGNLPERRSWRFPPWPTLAGVAVGPGLTWIIPAGAGICLPGMVEALTLADNPVVWILGEEYRQLQRLLSCSAACLGGAGPGEPDCSFSIFGEELAHQVAAEEERLFPALREVCRGAAEALASSREEHRRLLAVAEEVASALKEGAGPLARLRMEQLRELLGRHCRAELERLAPLLEQLTARRNTAWFRVGPDLRVEEWSEVLELVTGVSACRAKGRRFEEVARQSGGRLVTAGEPSLPPVWIFPDARGGAAAWLPPDPADRFRVNPAALAERASTPYPGGLRRSLEAALEDLKGRARADAVELFLHHPWSREMVLGHCLGPVCPALREQVRFPLGEGYPGLVAALGRPLVSREVASDPRETRRRARDAGIRVYAAMPVWGDRQVLGSLHLAWTREEAPLEEAVELLSWARTPVGHAVAPLLEALSTGPGRDAALLAELYPTELLEGEGG